MLLLWGLLWTMPLHHLGVPPGIAPTIVISKSTVEEVASLSGTHKNTVREWVKAGLPTCDDKRPMLILGHDLATFLQARRVKINVLVGPAKSTASAAAPRNFPPVTWRIRNGFLFFL
jgi:hypothetical protein